MDYNYIRSVTNWINKSIEAIPENIRKIYRRVFIYELKKDVFEPLTSEEYNPFNPQHFAITLIDEMKKHFGWKTGKAIELLVKRL